MKACFKCGLIKPINDFYKHPKMGDGYLNKCKECTKKDTHKDYELKIQDVGYVEKERKRGREKYRRLYTGTGKANREAAKRWIEKYPEKRAAHLSAILIKEEGKENHHWCYQENYFKDVIFLTKKDHNKAHRFIIYDPKTKKYRRVDNKELLETKEAHEQFIKWCIANKED